jgi:hypothetical protein
VACGASPVAGVTSVDRNYVIQVSALSAFILCVGSRAIWKLYRPRSPVVPLHAGTASPANQAVVTVRVWGGGKCSLGVPS